MGTNPGAALPSVQWLFRDPVCVCLYIYIHIHAWSVIILQELPTVIVWL